MQTLTKSIALAAFILTMMFVSVSGAAQAADFTDTNVHNHQIVGMIAGPSIDDGPAMKLGGYPSGTEIVHTEPGARILRDPWGRYWVEVWSPWGWRLISGPHSSEEEAKDALEDFKNGRWPST